MQFKTGLTFILISLSLFAATGNAAFQCQNLFNADSINHQDSADQKQFLINFHKKLYTTFITRNEVVRYFKHDLKALTGYTQATGFQQFYQDFYSHDLNAKMDAVKVQTEIENSLFSRKSFHGSVFSGAVLKKDYIDPLSVVGKKFNFGYFLSTSKDKQTAEDFSRIRDAKVTPNTRKVIFLIESKRGKPISDISHFPNENEVLFSSSTEFVVTKISDIEFKDQPLRYISLTEANSKLSENFNIQIRDSLTDTPAELTDWKKGLEYIFANSRSIGLNATELKKIHQISTEHVSFEKSKKRSQLLSGEAISSKYSGHFRSSDSDYFISNGDHLDSSGQRYFKPNEIEGYLDNPFFFVQNVKKKSEQMFEADAHFVVPKEIEGIINMVLNEGQMAVTKSVSKRQYILNIFKLYKALISIHPFSDGNGRSIRLFIYSQLLKKNLPIEYFPTLSEYESSAARLAQEYVDGNQLTSQELN